MKRVNLLFAAAIAALCLGAPQQAEAQILSINQLEESIEDSENAIKERQDAIKDIESKIKEHKDAIKELEKQKKQLQSEIKQHTNARKVTHATRDNKVFDDEVSAVLLVPFNKTDVNEALKSFEGMETKEVLKKKQLVENYGSYTKELKNFLESQRTVFESEHWALQTVQSEVYKKFEKGLKGTKYYKIYDKKEKNPSIEYLDRVMDKITHFKNGGLKNKAAFDEIIEMLYAD
ncbi:MAG: hypothetical protein II428_04650 [Muribaculaceae bacterium]|nr:hypothetical protein [Muribaculaceae bacterium]